MIIDKSREASLFEVRRQLKDLTTRSAVVDGRLIAKLQRCEIARNREPDIPLLRGALVSLNGWKELIPGFEYRWTQIEVFCPFCDKFHRHGWESQFNGRYISHRGKHCPSSECYPNGYYISPFRKADHGYDEHVIKPGTVWVRRKGGNRAS